MELIERLLFGSESLWGGGVAHSVLILALVVALGVMLGKLKVAGVSLGVTGILFVGIAFSYFGMNIDEHLMHFLKEFGLILFVYSIGLQVGPGFSPRSARAASRSTSWRCWWWRWVSPRRWRSIILRDCP